MSRLKTSAIAKFLAWLVIAVSGLSLVGSALLIYDLQEEGLYSRDFSEIREEAYDRYNDRYSARVLDCLGEEDGDSNEFYFKNKNFRYGVIQADSYEELEQLDLNDPKNYVDRNFEKTIHLYDVHIFQCSISEKTYFESQNPNSLWGYYWIRNTGSFEKAYDIDSYIYDTDSGIFYCKTGEGSYYPVPNIILYVEGNGSAVIPISYDKEQREYIRAQESFQNKEDGVLELMIYDADVTGYLEIVEVLPAFTFLMFEELGIENGVCKQAYISADKYSEVATEEPEMNVSVDTAGDAWGTVYESYGTTVDIRRESLSTDTASAYIITNKDVRISPEGYLKVREEGDTSTNYFVLSFLPESLSTYGRDWLTADLYVKFEHVFGTLYQNRYSVIALLFASIGIFLAAFVFLCTCAGYRKGQEGLTENFINKVPFEIYLTVVGLLEVFAIYAIDGLSYDIGDFTDVFWIVMMVLVVLAAGLLLTAAGVEFFTRIKMKTIFSRTIIGWICSKLYRVVKGIWEFAVTHTNIVLRMGILFAAICFVELLLLGIAINNGGLGIIFLFLIEKAILFVVILVIAVWLQKLKEAGKHVAAGDLNYKINTDHMLFDFKEHGENLNSIGEGLSFAVEERMKSERFKTELITNVSHDIKTPLTSIINYVDLLQKGGVDEETKREYLEVLERQSARLKKLLEDLLEASKASTGNLTVTFETLEAGVFLVQTVGEFEAKTKAQRLELIIKKPEEPIYIQADGRHFWRVIDNLMNNVCKYAQPDTRVYINLEATEKEVCITFRNTSRYELNITSEELMERFVRGDSSRNTEGSGLGLSIAKSLMELMHGKFELIVDGDLFKVVLRFERVNAPN